MPTPRTLTPKRTESVTAPQALALLNNEFVLVHAQGDGVAAGEALRRTARSRSSTACRLVWGRAPTDAERSCSRPTPTKHGLANLCRVLFNTNEFLFAD